MDIFQQQLTTEYSNELLINGATNFFADYTTDNSVPYQVQFIPYKPSTSLSLMATNVLITYRVAKTVPGSITGKPFSGDPKDVAPKDWQDIDQNGTLYVGSKQYMDTLLEFCVTAASTQYADDAVKLFMRFMLLARAPLRGTGVSDLYFWQRMPDDAIEIKDDIYYTRTLQYFVRSLFVVATPQNTITQFNYFITPN